MLRLTDYLKPTEAASMLGVTVPTLRNWDKKGLLRALINPMSGHRLYKKEDIEGLMETIARSGE